MNFSYTNIPTTISRFINLGFSLALIVLSYSLGLGQSGIKPFSKVPLTNSFNTFDYDGGIQNWSIHQNSRGYIYVANNFGLLEFDGAKWRKYLLPNSTRTLSVFVDENDRIYTGGQNQLGYFDSNKAGFLEYYSLMEQLPSKRSIDNLWQIFKHNGNVLFNTNYSLVTYDGNGLKEIMFDHAIRDMYKVRGEVYIEVEDEGLYISHQDTYKFLENSEFFKDFKVNSILPYNEASILVFTEEGVIFTYKDGKIDSWNSHLSTILKSALINSALLLTDKSIAIGTQNSGLVIIKPSGEYKFHLTTSQGLNSNTVISMHEDQFKNLWVGLNNGISLIELGSPFSFISQSEGVYGTGYAGVLHNNTVYLGTNTGLYKQSENGKFLIVPGSEGQVYSIEEHNKQLFMGHHRGAFKISKDSAVALSNHIGTWQFEGPLKDGILLSGTYQGFDRYTANGQYLGKITGFNESSRLLEFDADTALWMSHGYKGAFRITFDSSYENIKEIQFYDQEKGFPSNILINVFKLGADLIFTAETGLFRYNVQEDRFDHIEELESLLGANAQISNLTMDDDGGIYYIIGNQKIGLLKQKSFSGYEKIESIFNRINKYISDDLENINIINDKNVFFGAKEGFIHYEPSNTYSPKEEFYCFIRSITLSSNDSIIYFGGSTLPVNSSFDSDNNSLIIDYAAPYFSGYSDITYQYQLENFDDQWSEWTSTTSKEYTNLRKGNYTFKVRAKNIYDGISSTVSYSFKVSPPWYLSDLAVTIYSILVLALFGSSLLILDTKHRSDKVKLEENQKQEIQQKDFELKTFSEESNQAIGQLKNEKLLAEIEFKTKELASSTMHLLNKNEIMLSIKSNLQEIAPDSVNKIALNKIIRTIDTNVAEDDNWEQFTQHFDQVHGDFLKRLKDEYTGITPQETRLAAYLRMNLSTKNIAQLSNISVRGVEIGRYRLRKKLSLSRDVNLTSFLMEY